MSDTTDTDTDVTELTELHAAKVSGVTAPANGTPFLLMKAAAEKSAEADEFEEEVTKTEDGNEVSSKALSAKDRKKMPTSSFAFVDKKGGKHLPIHDAPHVKAALGRFGQQDFSEAKGNPADAKQAAARKIKAAAKKHGIEVSDDAEVSSAAKGQVQDGLNGTATPAEAGHLATGQSHTDGAVVIGTRVTATDASRTLGGDTTSVIPDVTKVDHDSPVPTSTDAAGIVKARAVASLVEAMDALDEQRQAIKDGKYLQVGNQVDAPNVPLSELSSTLASCCRTMEQHLQQERLEAAINPNESHDVWDMEDAKCALESATRLVAFIAAMEEAEGEVTKDLDVEKLIDARNTLDVIVEVTKASSAGSDDEETITVADVTKSELAEAIAASTVEAVKQAFKERKAEKQAKKEAAAEEAAKNANNGGDISEADIKPTKETDSDDINAVKGDESADEDATKGDGTAEGELSKQVTTQLDTLTKGLADVTELVTKIAKRPRTGGPSLDGQVRPAAEGRQSEVSKSAEDVDIETLTKSLEQETDPQKKSELGLRLTRARLVKLHETGQL